MRYDQLEHAIRAACEVADDSEVLIFGSQAILGSYPNAPKGLRASIEVDVQPKNKPETTDMVDGTLGEGSLFHATHGFYVHGIPIDAAVLPQDWEVRRVGVTHPVGTRGKTGWCLEAHDLAASKLAAYRQKDLQFVALLLSEKLIDANTLLTRIDELPIDAEQTTRLQRWVRAIANIE